MNNSLSRIILTPALAVVSLVMCNPALAQGTANGPVTSHTVDPGPIVLIGDPLSPIPIDLDPNGQPWTKNIVDPNLLMINGGPLEIIENILNAGTEPWLDWHEHILPDAIGVIPGVWSNVNLSVNGNPILFNSLGLNTSDLWLDSFSQPVLPGDVLEIRKTVDAFATPALFTMRIQEYPTPEPASAALIGVGSLMLLGKRRWRSS